MRRAVFVFLLSGAAVAPVQDRVNADRLLEDVRTLSQPAFEGRLTGTEGNHKAQAFILERFHELDLKPVAGSFDQPFAFRDITDARNLMGEIVGSTEPGRFIAMTAHYDHLGTRDGSIYAGADDDASGVATLLAAAEYFARHQPRRSIIFVAFDGEEEGLRGSTFFVMHPPVPLASIALEVNFDMVARGDKNELFVAGTSYSPELKAPLVELARRHHLTLSFGHDTRGGDDWTHASDHGPFHDAGIPFLYFGVEDHPDYHKPGDTVDKIPRAFFADAASLIIDTVAAFDARGVPR